MDYKIFLSRQANKYIKDADETLQFRVRELFEILVKNPLPLDKYDIASVKGVKKGYRIRLGKHRVIIQLFPSQKNINVLKIDKRGTAYKNI